MGILLDFVNFQKNNIFELDEFSDIAEYVRNNCSDKKMPSRTAQKITGKVVSAIERKIYGQTD